MENLVPLGTGNSRFMKSNISPNTTLVQLIQMLNNGTFPYDIGPINPAGISQQGTPLNKDTLLKDATALLYSLSNTAVPDDVFNDIYSRLIMIAQDKARLIVTVKDTSGAPIPNTLISGLQDESGGNSVLTDENGIATGYADEGTASIGVSGYADLVDKTVSQSVQKGITYKLDIEVETRNFLKITKSGNWKFSGLLQRVDVTVVGGGGGGSGAYINYPGSGGGGGYCTVSENVDFVPNQSYSAVIGSGGAAGPSYNGYESGPAKGGNGGNSSFLDITASGGRGGSGTVGGAGNGKGGSNASSGVRNGSDGTVEGYSSFTETVRYGGGGGAGQGAPGLYANTAEAVGGDDYGGNGGITYSGPFTPTAPGANTGGGGGGGATNSTNDNYFEGAKGGSGVITLRMYHSVA